jgi:two-component system chemotaxis response regulator CheB
LALSDDIDVVGEVRDASVAVDAVVALRPNVVLMDVVMPGCDGYQATRAIMDRAPTPVVMVTAAENPRDERVVIEALGAGALSVTHAPPPPGSPSYRLASATLAQLLRAMSRANLSAVPASASEPHRHMDPVSQQPRELTSARFSAIGIVASAGGPPALVAVLQELAKPPMPPILVVQHMTQGFVPGFARWLSESTGFSVVVAAHGARLAPHTVYLPPEDRHLGVSRELTALVTRDAPVGVFRPSADYLLSSLGRALGPAGLGVVLSGMGADGAAGAVELAASGGLVVAQDAATAAVDGMPRAVRERVPSAVVLPLDGIASFLVKQVSEK